LKVKLFDIYYVQNALIKSVKSVLTVSIILSFFPTLYFNFIAVTVLSKKYWVILTNMYLLEG